MPREVGLPARGLVGAGLPADPGRWRRVGGPRGTAWGRARRGSRGALPRDEAPTGSTVLVVEDNAALRELVRQVLEPDGHRVLLAPTCAAARDAYAGAGGDVDVLLCDLVLPDGSGTDLAGDLAARDDDLRVLVMTGQAAEDIDGDPAWRSRGGLIHKPFDVGELARRVGELVG